MRALVPEPIVAVPLRKSVPVAYPRGADVHRAFHAVSAECLQHLRLNIAALVDGGPALQAERVHQCRVAIRRLRTALRCFDGWLPDPPGPLLDGLRRLFVQLGECRDRDVLAGGVVQALRRAGAPEPVAHAVGAAAAPDPAALVASADAQATLQGWLRWHDALAGRPEVEDSMAVEAACTQPAGAAAEVDIEVDGEVDVPVEDAALPERVQRRLRRWHHRIVAEIEAFDALDEAALHALRKRIKRQRYAVEFFAPLLRRRKVARYLAALAPAQEQMGLLNDLFVARQHYQGLRPDDPAAWFALGWLAARLAQQREAARAQLRPLRKVAPP